MQPMRTFGFDVLTLDQEIHSVDLGEFQTTAAAVAYARKILRASLTGAVIDVWCDGVRVAQVERGATPQPAPHQASMGMNA